MMRIAGVVVALAATLSACQPKRPVSVIAPSGKSASLRTMEQVALAAQNCWFAAKDPAFRSYRLSNELGSFSGRPRILIVPAKSMESRPVLVVQAEGASARVESFGPLLNGGDGSRISADIARWSRGDSSCAARA